MKQTFTEYLADNYPTWAAILEKHIAYGIPMLNDFAEEWHEYLMNSEQNQRGSVATAAEHRSEP